MRALPSRSAKAAETHGESPYPDSQFQRESNRRAATTSEPTALISMKSGAVNSLLCHSRRLARGW